MSEVTSFVKAAQSVRTFIAWLNGGGAARILADIELEAAAAAFRNLNLTLDAKAQLWNAINHLETAYYASYSQLKDGGHSLKYAFLLHRRNLSELRSRCELLVCLLAVCYKLLGEEQLVVKQLEELHKLSGLSDPQNGAADLLMVLTAFPQLVFMVGARAPRVYITRDQRDEIEQLVKRPLGRG